MILGPSLLRLSARNHGGCGGLERFNVGHGFVADLAMGNDHDDWFVDHKPRGIEISAFITRERRSAPGLDVLLESRQAVAGQVVFTGKHKRLSVVILGVELDGHLQDSAFLGFIDLAFEHFGTNESTRIVADRGDAGWVFEMEDEIGFSVLIGDLVTIDVGVSDLSSHIVLLLAGLDFRGVTLTRVSG